MKSDSPRILLPSCLLLVAAACVPAIGAPDLNPVPTAPPVGLASPTPTSPPTAQPLSFVSATYTDEVNGFKLDYPADWSLQPNTAIGSRGSQAQLLSPGTTAETLAPGGTRLSITVYQWDPRHDLAAFVTQRRAAWDAGGSKLLSEAKGDLMDGRKAMDFVVEGPDGLKSYFLFTDLGEQYLQIAGEGDLALIGEIANTFRPLNFQP